MTDYLGKVIDGTIAYNMAKLNQDASTPTNGGATPTQPRDPQARAENASTTGAPSSKTLLYIAGGAAVLVVGVVALSAMGKKR